MDTKRGFVQLYFLAATMLNKTSEIRDRLGGWVEFPLFLRACVCVCVCVCGGGWIGRDTDR